MKIRLIVPYFGSWPIWFPAYLQSCKFNENLEWLFLTDIDRPAFAPPNVRFEHMSLSDLNELASKATGLEIAKNAYSQCDIRPAYGVVFAEYLRDVDFWGHCDVDVIWGMTEMLFTPRILSNFDVITPRYRQLAGHLTIYRNDDSINSLYQRIPDVKSLLERSEYCRMDESRMAEVLLSSKDARVFWRAQHTADAKEIDKHPRGWTWRRGLLIGPDEIPRTNLHFMNWKRSISRIDFEFEDDPAAFTIAPEAILAGPTALQDNVNRLLHEPTRLFRVTRSEIRFLLTGRGKR